jgi:hypothetical protein
LGREPDADGARAYETLIRKLGAEQALPKMLKAFVRSAEYHERANALAMSYINRSLASQGERLINGSPVNHLISLGSFCLPALIFRDHGLRRYSLPFDWIFSTPPMVRECLADDFAGFLDRRYYRSITGPGRRDPGAEHDLYRERYGLPGLFAHHDPTQESHYLHFVRCVTRFREVMRSQDVKLFLLMGRPHHDLASEFPLMLEALHRAASNFVLICVELLDPVERGLTNLTSVARTGEHGLYRFTPSSYNAIGGFLPDKLDEWTLLRLVYGHKLDLKDSPWNGSEPAVADLVPSEQHDKEQRLEHVLR